MHEWLEGLQKSAVRTSGAVAQEDIQRAETQSGVPLPEELSSLFRTFNGGEFQGDVVLFELHGPEGSPSVLEKSRLMVEGLPAAGLWRIGLKGAHRHVFSALKSALQEQAEGPLPTWVETLSGDEWIYGTWDTDSRELRLYRSLRIMLEVLVPPAEKDVEEFGDRTYARALSAVQGALSDLSVEYEDSGTPKASGAEDDDEAGDGEAEDAADEGVEEDASDDEDAADEDASDDEGDEEDTSDDEDEDEEAPLPLRDAVADSDEEDDAGEDSVSDAALKQPVVAAARRRIGKLKKEDAPEAPAAVETKAPAKKAPAKKAGATGASTKTTAAKKAPAKRAAKAPAKQASTKTAPAKKAPAKQAAKAPAKQARTKQAAKAPAKQAGKKVPAKQAAKKVPAKKAPVQKAPAKKGSAKKAPAKKAPAKQAAKKAPAKNAARKAPAKKASSGRGRR